MGLIYYAGIGSRETPDNILDLMEKLASVLEDAGWILRSGGAKGADSAFEKGIKDSDNMQIFLPGYRFNGKTSLGSGFYDATFLPSYSEALKTVSQFHPSPNNLSEFGLKAMARNAMQVLGANLKTPSKVVIAWTRGGFISGGTGQALRIANHHGIPVLNLGQIDTRETVRQWLDGRVVGTEHWPLPPSVLY